MVRSYAKAYDDVWGDKRLSNNDVMVYTGLVRHSYGDTMTVKHLGIRKLAEYCRVTPNTFNSCVKHLEECGWLEVVREDKSRSEYHLLAPEVVEDSVETVEKPTPRPKKQKLHKTIKSAKQDTPKQPTSSSGKYSDQRKNYYKTLKSYAESLDIAEAWRNEILEWVNRVLDQMPSVMDEKSPKDLFIDGTRKFARSELRFEGY